jgi:VWFA-related protein
MISGLLLGTALLVSLPSLMLAQTIQSVSPDKVEAQKDPELKLRPPPKPEAAPEGAIHLDVVVTDATGKVITGLERKDFSVLDNNHPQPILTFRSIEDQTLSTPPVEVIILIDTVNASLIQVELMRVGAEKFLRLNEGKLAHPTSIFWFTDEGLKVQPRPSKDGNTLADLIHQVPSSVHSIRSASGFEGQLERLQLSAKTLSLIANSEMKRPARKILIWTGPGWPLMAGETSLYNARGHELNFESIISFSDALRRARIELCAPGAGSSFYVSDFLKGVKSAREANSGNLALPVLALQSGGLSLDPGNASNLVDQMQTCARDAAAYYSLSFDPEKAEKPNEYHELKVRVDLSGLTVRTSSGYYGQP